MNAIVENNKTNGYSIHYDSRHIVSLNIQELDMDQGPCYNIYEFTLVSIIFLSLCGFLHALLLIVWMNIPSCQLPKNCTNQIFWGWGLCHGEIKICSSNISLFLFSWVYSIIRLRFSSEINSFVLDLSVQWNINS